MGLNKQAAYKFIFQKQQTTKQFKFTDYTKYSQIVSSN